MELLEVGPLRREALVFDKCHQRARLALRKAANDACQLTRTMQQRHPNGVIGVEGPNCDDSLIYRDQRSDRAEIVAYVADHQKARYDNLRLKRDTQLPYKLLSHDPSNTSEEVMFPKKARVPNRQPYSSSFEMRASGASPTAFRSNQEKPLRAGADEGRAQQLHTRTTGGKPYDIITGARLAVEPSAIDRGVLHDRRSHPSNHSMPHRGGTAPTLVGPIPDAHKVSWKPPSPSKTGSQQYMR